MLLDNICFRTFLFFLIFIFNFSFCSCFFVFEKCLNCDYIWDYVSHFLTCFAYIDVYVIWQYMRIERIHIVLYFEYSLLQQNSNFAINFLCLFVVFVLICCCLWIDLWLFFVCLFLVYFFYQIWMKIVEKNVVYLFYLFLYFVGYFFAVYSQICCDFFLVCFYFFLYLYWIEIINKYRLLFICGFFFCYLLFFYGIFIFLFIRSFFVVVLWYI